VLRAMHVGPDPLLALPICTDVNAAGHTFVTTPFAGQSVRQLLGENGPWGNLPAVQREHLALKMAATLLKAQTIYESVVSTRPLSRPALLPRVHNQLSVPALHHAPCRT